MWRAAATLASALCAVSALSACAGSNSDASKQSSASAAATPAASATTGANRASGRRPKEVRIEGHDPCRLIPEEDSAKFFLEGPGEARSDPVSHEPQCAYFTNVGTFGLTLNTTQGLQEWIDQSGGADIDKNAAPVRGFTAVQYKIPAFEDDLCGTVVDVADGQILEVDVFIVKSRQSDLPPCPTSRAFAESVMTTLLQRRRQPHDPASGHTPSPKQVNQ